MSDFNYPENFIKYLGTGGARFCMVRQTRWTGGMWFSYGGLNGVIDPGPGSLHHICEASPVLDPHSVRAILLTHRHLDHSTDINVISEAMTGGGFEKQGTIVAPADCVTGHDPVLLRYSAGKVGRVVTPEDAQIVELGDGVFVEAVGLIHHGVQCFGWIFRGAGLPTWGVISDTKPLDCLAKRYSDCSYISINATFPDKKPRLQHMSMADTGELLLSLHPRLATITHMGLMLVQNEPQKLAKNISTAQTRVLAGEDGMVVDLDSLRVYAPKPVPKIASEYRVI